MLSVRGTTYRVSKVCDGTYEVVRIIDDHRIGTFESNPRLQVTAEGVDEELLREIAYVAMKQGKVSSVGPLPNV
jgi:hypothetical protein